MSMFYYINQIIKHFNKHNYSRVADNSTYLAVQNFNLQIKIVLYCAMVDCGVKVEVTPKMT